MANVTLAIDEKTAERMKMDKATNYSELCRKAIRNYFLDKTIPRADEQELSTNNFFDMVKRIASKIEFNPAGNSKYGGGPSWLINLGFRAMRLQEYEEAAYCFDGARCANVKYISEPNIIESTLNDALMILRDFCIALSGKDPGDIERFFYSKAKPYLIYLKSVDYFPNDPSERNYVRFDNKKFFANTLYFVLAFMMANESPIPSRSEVDPFGATMSVANRNYVLNLVAKLLKEPVEKEDPKKRDLKLNCQVLFEFITEIERSEKVTK